MRLILRSAYLSVLCTGVMGIISVKAWAQPTVTVPIHCNVVVAGQGGTIGFGGTVGNGGIITMPDPFPTPLFPNTTFTINTNGTSANDWFLAGDLSIYPNTQPNPAIQSASGGSVDIMSYNKSKRISESAAHGRSIGRITIPYDDSACSSSISFTVYKVYSDPLPPIIGPECWLPDSTYTYSVDQIASDNLADGIGLDVYYWTVVDNNGDTIYDSQQNPLLFPESYTSADKSSITTKVPSILASPYTITCCFGRANPWDGNNPLTVHTSCVTRIIGASPPAPQLIMDTCVSVASTSFNITVSPYDPSFNYVWSASNPQWLINPIPGGAVVSGLGQNGGIIYLEVKNGGCSSVITSKAVNRSFDSALVSLVGDDCVSANTTHNYQLSPVGVQGNFTCWEVPAGWIMDSLNSTNSDVNITIPAGTPGGSYVLKAYSCACPEDTIYLTVRVRPGDPSIVSGATCITYGSTANQTYTVSPAGNYQWTIPSGWSGTSTTETIVVTPNGTTTGQIIATGIDTSGMGCTSLNPAVWNVNFDPVDPISATIGCISAGINGTTTLVVSNAPSPFIGTYVVTTTPADLLTGYYVNPSNGQITLYTSGDASASSYTIYVTHQTNCGTSTTLSIPVTYGSGSTLWMVPLPSSDLYYINPPVPGASSYAWFLDGVPHGNPGPTLSLFGTNTPPDTVCVQVTRTDGCITKLCTPGGTYSALIIGDGNSGSMMNNNIRVFPNPSKGEFAISIEKMEKHANYTIMDMKGVILAENQSLMQGTNRIVNKQLIRGTYVLIVTVDGKTHAQKIEVIH